MSPGPYYRLTYDGMVYCGFMADPKFMRYKASVEGNTALPIECLWSLYCASTQCLNVPGEFVECGVDRGGSARLLAQVMHDSGKYLHLFDTFTGMPETDPLLDLHKKGDFPEVGIHKVASYIGHENEVKLHPGIVPQSFEGLEQMKVAFAHLDLDIHSATLGACSFLYPRMAKGGIMVFDDYGRPSCPGARKAIDDYFRDKPEVPLPYLASGQAFIFKL